LDSDIAQLEPILPPEIFVDQSETNLLLTDDSTDGMLQGQEIASNGYQTVPGLYGGGYGSVGSPGLTLPPTVPSIPQPVPESSSILLMMFGSVLFLIAFRSDLVYSK
jgi:hypothetical protein